MTFLWPFLLPALLLVPLAIWRYRRLLHQRRHHSAALGTLGQLYQQTGQPLGRRRHVPFACFIVALTLLLLGLARPQMPVSLPRLEGTVILAFDVSNSMIAEDLEPTRIDAAKVAARAFVEQQPATIQIGVVAFGNGGLVAQPPTNDQTEVLAAIERLNPQGGTSLGQGIFTALVAIAGDTLPIDESAFDPESFDESAPPLQIGSFPSAVVLLLTDGENTAPPDPLTVAQSAAEAQIRIYPIGIGSPEGAVIDVEGFKILTQLNEGALEEIAALTNGAYYHAADADQLREIYETIDLQLTVRGQEMEITALLAMGAFLFALAGGTLSMLWFRRIP
ncbi:MAG: VWA domain-containing protein [Caldilineaceae bacterium]|nr:VWA domain-containing protein [Caldilineaceae bacterium]